MVDLLTGFPGRDQTSLLARMRIILTCSLPILAMRFRVAISGLALLGLAQSPASSSQLDVVAVDGTLCDLTSTLVGSAAQVTCLIPPGGNPHGYQLKPSDRQTLAKAALILHNGFDLTPAANKISSSAPIVAVGEKVLPNYQGNDPHVWHDPTTSEGMVRVISTELSKILPDAEQAALTERTTQAVSVFSGLSQWGSAQFAALPENRRVITTDHRTYSHMAERFGFKEIAMLDSHTTGGVLRPSSLKVISDEIKSSGSLVIFKPSFEPTKTLKRISKRSGVPISTNRLEGEGVSPGGTAVSTAVSNICTMVNGQNGQCDQASGDRLVNSWKSIR